MQEEHQNCARLCYGSCKSETGTTQMDEKSKRELYCDSAKHWSTVQVAFLAASAAITRGFNGWPIVLTTVLAFLALASMLLGLRFVIRCADMAGSFWLQQVGFYLSLIAFVGGLLAVGDAARAEVPPCICSCDCR